MGHEDTPPSDDVEFLDVGPPPRRAGNQDQRPRRWPRWLPLALAAALTAIIIAAVVERGARPSGRPSGIPLTTSRPAAATSVPPSEARSTPGNTPAVAVTNVGHPLLDVTAPWELFGRGAGVVVRIEPALGRITRTSVPDLRSTGPVFFVVGPNQAIVRPLDVVPGYLVPDGQPSQVMSPRLAPAGPIFPGPNPIQVWAQASVGDRPDMTLVDLRDYQPVTTVTLPAESSPVQAFGDGAGYLVSPGVGGFYDARPDGLHLITAGELLAVGPTGWLATECDHRHRCTTVSIDRATGTRRVVAAAGAVSSGPPGVISPDGATAALLLGGSPGAIAVELIDLATGHRRHVDLTLDDAVLDATMVWSPDSRWLFTIGAGGTLRAIDRGTGGVRSLGVSLPGLSQLALRNRLR